MRWWYLALALFCTGCAEKLPPHVWMQVRHVEGVDLFWWTDTGRCQVRVITQKTPDEYGSFTVDIDAAICLEALRARGYSTGVK